jgi:hypothetical protein
MKSFPLNLPELLYYCTTCSVFGCDTTSGDVTSAAATTSTTANTAGASIDAAARQGGAPAGAPE